MYFHDHILHLFSSVLFSLYSPLIMKFFTNLKFGTCSTVVWMTRTVHAQCLAIILSVYEFGFLWRVLFFFLVAIATPSVHQF